MRYRIAKLLRGEQVHATDVALTRAVFDDLRVHGTNPLSDQRGIEHVAAGGQLTANQSSHEHSRLELPIRVGYVDTNAYGPGLVREHGIDKRHAALEDLARIALRRELDLLPVPQPGDVRFVGVQIDPDDREIHNRVDLGPRLDIHPFIRNLFDHNAAARGKDGQVVRRLAKSFDLLDLLR